MCVLATFCFFTTFVLFLKHWLKKIGCENGWMNMEQSKKYQKKYPLMTRDNGGAILELIYNSKDSINWINNSEEFVGDVVVS